MAVIDSLNELASVALAALLNSFLVTVLMIAGVGLVLRFARSLNASTRHAIWWAVLAALLIIPPARTVMSMRSATTETLAPVVDEQSRPAVLLTAPADAELPLSVPEPAGSLEVDGGYAPLLFVFAVASVFVVQLGRVAWSYLHLRALKKSGLAPERALRLSFDEWLLACRVERPVRLLTSDSIPSPIAVGFRNPAVILPRSVVEHLSADDLDHMILHELAHLARRDDWSNLLARLAWGTLAWHPLAAYILSRIDDEREIACDDWVVCMTGQARTYAVSLSRLIEFRLARSREMLATGIVGRRSQLGDRIERLLQAGRQFDAKLSFARVGATLAVLLALVAAGVKAPGWVAFAQAESAPPSPPSPVDAEIAGDVVPPAIPVPPVPPIAAAPRITPPTPPQPVPPVRLFVVPQPPVQDRVEVAVPTPPPPPVSPVAVAFLPQAATPPPPQAPATPVPPPPPPPESGSRASSGGSFLKALSDAGYRDLPVEDIIYLRTRGITASYLAEMNQAGWGRLTPRQLADLRDHGVRPEVARDINSVGLSKFGVEDMIDFRRHGVGAELIRGFKEAGFTNVTPKEIVEARNHGVTAQNLHDARKLGSQLSVRQIIRLKHAGVL